MRGGDRDSARPDSKIRTRFWLVTYETQNAFHASRSLWDAPCNQLGRSTILKYQTEHRRNLGQIRVTMFVTLRISTSPWVVICAAKLLNLPHPTRLLTGELQVRVLPEEPIFSSSSTGHLFQLGRVGTRFGTRCMFRLLTDWPSLRQNCPRSRVDCRSHALRYRLHVHLTHIADSIATMTVYLQSACPSRPA
jgi:hypothetical protein